MSRKIFKRNREVHSKILYSMFDIYAAMRQV